MARGLVATFVAMMTVVSAAAVPLPALVGADVSVRPCCPCVAVGASIKGAKPVIGRKNISFVDMGLLPEVIEFDPVLTKWGLPREDLTNMLAWECGYGLHPISHTKTGKCNAWKNDPNRDLSHLSSHFSRGFPSPVPYVAECECIALRNAREVAEQCKHFDWHLKFPLL